MTKKPPSKRKPATSGLDGWVHILTAGDHEDSKGREVSFSRDDLDQMIANHTLGAAPAVLGHPQHDSPAYAKVGEYRRDDDRLFARFTDVNPAFEAGVKSGAYYNRSVRVLRDKKHGWRVRHVGWLGAQPPAIDGLLPVGTPVEFSAAEGDEHDFAGEQQLLWGLESVVRLMRGLRDHLIEKDGVEATDKVLPQWQIDSAAESIAGARTEINALRERADFSKPPTGEETTMFTQEQIDAAVAQARKEAEDKAAADFAAKDQELIQLKAERQAERIATQIGQWKKDAKLLPAEEPGLAEFMASLENADEAEFSFSAADGTQAKKTAVQFFADFMGARGAVVKVGQEKAGGGTDVPAVDQTSARAIADAATDFQASELKAGREISIDAAVAHVTTTRRG
ncbi:MAG: hypothetical protein QM617_09140 [Comamonas sp.]